MDAFCREALENGPDGCLIFENGRCVFYSPAYHRIVQYDPGVPLDSSATALKELLHPEDRDRVLDTFDAAVRRRRPYASYAFRGRVRDGSYRWREDSARLVYDERGSHVRTYVVARDIEGRMEDPFFLPRAKRTESRELHHRVKNDLELVRSYLSLQAHAMGEQEAGSVVIDAADRVGSLVALYDTIYHSEAGECVDAEELLERLLRHLRVKASEKELSITGEASHGLPLPAELARVMSIMINELVTNAIKHAEIDSGRVEIQVQIEGADEGTTLTVRDSGPGFPDYLLRGESSGFGLEIVKSLARQHNAALLLKNELGAVVRCTFP